MRTAGLASAANAGAEALLRHERLVIAGALSAVTAIAWIYLARMGLAHVAGMGDPGMIAAHEAGMEHSGMVMAQTWSGPHFAAMLLMWIVMMTGMMTPSAARTVLLYAALHRASGGGRAYPASALFVAGYLLAWTAYALAATLLQMQLATAGLLSPEMKALPVLGALLLLGAGAYQLLPAKNACLSHCRSPEQFLVAHRTSGPLWLGLRHGAYCVGCCWLLMAVLFAVGVMSLPWVAALTALVLAEKLLPAGRHVARAGGVVMIVAAVAMLATAG